MSAAGERGGGRGLHGQEVHTVWGLHGQEAPTGHDVLGCSMPRVNSDTVWTHDLTSGGVLKRMVSGDA